MGLLDCSQDLEALNDFSLRRLLESRDFSRDELVLDGLGDFSLRGLQVLDGLGDFSSRGLLGEGDFSLGLLVLEGLGDFSFRDLLGEGDFSLGLLVLDGLGDFSF